MIDFDSPESRQVIQEAETLVVQRRRLVELQIEEDYFEDVQTALDRMDQIDSPDRAIEDQEDREAAKVAIGLGALLVGVVAASYDNLSPLEMAVGSGVGLIMVGSGIGLATKRFWNNYLPTRFKGAN